MCKGLISNVKFLCGDPLKDAPTALIPWDGCGNCGIMKAGPAYMGQSIRREPCPDCINRGGWTMFGVLYVPVGGSNRMGLQYQRPSHHHTSQRYRRRGLSSRH
ncbi:hypothetical protein BJX96DRAFT_11647 [Aspergillus floccosus]